MHGGGRPTPFLTSGSVRKRSWRSGRCSLVPVHVSPSESWRSRSWAAASLATRSAQLNQRSLDGSLRSWRPAPTNGSGGHDNDGADLNYGAAAGDDNQRHCDERLIPRDEQTAAPDVSRPTASGRIPENLSGA
jgi:hypothetical protein